MRVFLFAPVGALLMFGATMAPAADIVAPLIRPPVAATVYNWSGVYLGGHFGGGWSTIDETVTTAFPGTPIFFPAGTLFSTTNFDGPLGGLQAGYTWQIDRWVIGVQGQYSWSDLTGNVTTISAAVPTISNVISAKLSDVALATGRLGYAWDNWLFYAKGGGAWGETKTTSENLLNSSSMVSGTFAGGGRSGWTIGGGIEWGFWDNWSVQFEYNHIDFGTQAVSNMGTSGAIAGTTSMANARDTVDMVTVGANYRINWWH